MNLYERLKDYPRINDNGDRLPAWKRHLGEVGLEIETEAPGVYDVPLFKFWKAHNDPSLRGVMNMEYVLAQPLKFDVELPQALQEFGAFARHIPFIQDSITTSVHVHLNFLNSTFKDMGNFITAYVLTENLLSEYAGDYRKSNLFCLPVRDAEETYKHCVTFFQKAENQKYLDIFFKEGTLKYAALNLSAFRNFGSLEVRSFRGVTDIDVIQDWVDILKNLYRYAHQDRNPKSILLDWKNKGLGILDDIYKEKAKKLIHANALAELEHNVWYAASIAYSIKDWSKLDVVIEKQKEFKPTAKQMNEAAKALFGIPLADLDPAQIDHVINALRMNAEGMIQKQKRDAVQLMQPAWMDEAIQAVRPNGRAINAPVIGDRDR